MSGIVSNSAGRDYRADVDAQYASKVFESFGNDGAPPQEIEFLDRVFVYYEQPSLCVVTQWVADSDLEFQFYPPHLDAEFTDFEAFSESIRDILSQLLNSAYGTRAPTVQAQHFPHRQKHRTVLWHNYARSGMDLLQVKIFGMRSRPGWEPLFKEFMDRVFKAERDRLTT